MTKAAPGEVTRLLAALNEGDGEALPALLPLVYDELHGLATRYLRHERRALTLQPTVLVHEAYLRLVGQRAVHWQNRAHFFGIAAQAMRRILVDHARAHRALKRGGRREDVPLDEVMVSAPEQAVDVLLLDEALARLAAVDPRQARLVELRFFGGLTVEETAAVLDMSATTVKREWRVARAWVHREMSGGGEHRVAH